MQIYNHFNKCIQKIKTKAQNKHKALQTLGFWLELKIVNK